MRWRVELGRSRTCDGWFRKRNVSERRPADPLPAKDNAEPVIIETSIRRCERLAHRWRRLTSREIRLGCLQRGCPSKGEAMIRSTVAALVVTSALVGVSQAQSIFGGGPRYDGTVKIVELIG